MMSESRDDVPTVLFPNAWFTKANLTARRELGLADPPPRQLPPIEHRLCIVAEHDRNAGGAFAVENSQCEPRCVVTDWTGSDNQTTCTAMTELSFRIDYDWSVRR